MDSLILIVLGAAVGFAIGLTGIGGGSLMTPILLTLGIPAPIAIGTDLCYAAITKSGGIIAHQRQKNINWDVVFFLSTGSIPGVIAVTIFKLEASAALFSNILIYSIGLMLTVTSLLLLFHRSLGYFNRNIHYTTNLEKPKLYWLSCILIGAVVGFFVTLTSVGAGSLGTVALIFLFPKMFPSHIVGTDIAHAVPLTTLAAIVNIILGNVDFKLLALLLAGSLPCIFISSYLSNKIPANSLRYILALMLLFFGLKYLFFS